MSPKRYRRRPGQPQPELMIRGGGHAASRTGRRWTSPRSEELRSSDAPRSAEWATAYGRSPGLRINASGRPSRAGAQWPWWSALSAHSCGGSRGIAQGAHRVPFSPLGRGLGEPLRGADDAIRLQPCQPGDPPRRFIANERGSAQPSFPRTRESIPEAVDPMEAAPRQAERPRDWTPAFAGVTKACVAGKKKRRRSGAVRNGPAYSWAA